MIQGTDLLWVLILLPISLIILALKEHFEHRKQMNLSGSLIRHLMFFIGGIGIFVYGAVINSWVILVIGFVVAMGIILFAYHIPPKNKVTS